MLLEECVWRCYLCWGTSGHPTAADETRGLVTVANSLFPLLFIISCQDKQQQYDVLEEMKEELWLGGED